MSGTLLVLFAALLLDWRFGEPEPLWSRLPHPVVVFGNSIAFFDKRLNNHEASDDTRLRNGAITILVLIVLSLAAGALLALAFRKLGAFGLALETIVVFVLLAQKSLHDHVQAVCDGLETAGLAGGRRAIGLIVGRDPDTLDERGVIRAAIETLAENFSDGVVAPAFWYAVAGLPGILAYKMINTADSMIGYRNARYEHFGKAAARIDDFANWVPARISALLLAAGALLGRGAEAAKQALATAMRDAGLHASPNAGWPEGAMAGTLGIALGGPRAYPGNMVQQAHINGAGRMALVRKDIADALGVFRFACFALMAIVLTAAFII